MLTSDTPNAETVHIARDCLPHCATLFLLSVSAAPVCLGVCAVRLSVLDTLNRHAHAALLTRCEAPFENPLGCGWTYRESVPLLGI